MRVRVVCGVRCVGVDWGVFVEATIEDDEVRQAIEDVKRQNGITSQEALVAALAGQGMSFEQYRAQLQEQPSGLLGDRGGERGD